MNKTIILSAALLLLLSACGSKNNQPADSMDTVEVALEQPSDSLIAVQEVTDLVAAVYDYLANYQEGQPSLDERFGNEEWRAAAAALNETDKDADDPLFSDGYNPWSLDLYEGRITPDSITARLMDNGMAVASFKLKDAMSKTGLPVTWVLKKENDEWRVKTIIDGNDDYLEMMRVYTDDKKFNEGFDIAPYLPTVNAQGSKEFGLDAEATPFNEYALTDIDRDGKAELCVRSEESGYSMVFSIDGEKAEQLASADGRTMLVFFEHGVGSQGSCGTGCHYAGYSIIKNSRKAFSLHFMEQMDMEGEVVESGYMKDDKDINAEEGDRLMEELGEMVNLTPIWHVIEPGEVVENVFDLAD